MIDVIKKEKTFLFFLLFLSLLVRSLFFVFFLSKNGNFRNMHSSDSYQYTDIALQIARGKGISISNCSPTSLCDWHQDFFFLPEIYKGEKIEKPQVTPVFYRIPGYPLFISLFYYLFGQDNIIVLWVQLILSAFLAILIFLLSLALFPANILAAKVSSIFAALYFGFVLYSGTLMTESLFLICLVPFFILFFKSFNLFFCGPNYLMFSGKRMFFAGIFLGLASLIRPLGFCLIILSGLMFLFSRFNWREKLKGNFLLFVGWFLIVSWWLLRNLLLTGYLFFHTLAGRHFFIYPATRIAMRVYDCDYLEAKKIVEKEFVDKILANEERREIRLKEIERSLIAEEISKKYFKMRPYLFIKHSIYHMLQTMFSCHSDDLRWLNLKISASYNEKASFFKNIKNYFLPMLWNNSFIFWVYLELLFLIGFFGYLLIALFYFERFCILAKVLPYIFLFIFVTLATGFARLRLPVDPFLIVLSANFWIYLLRKRFARSLSE